MTIRRWVCEVALLAALAAGPAGGAHASLIDEAAKRAGVDPKVLRAIVMTESQGHPWTVNVNGEPFFLESRQSAANLIRRVQSEPWMIVASEAGKKNVRYFFATEQDAQAAVEQLSAKVTWTLRKVDARMIDVGLMQLNLHYHGRQMKTLEEGLSPKWNLAYGATYLAQLVKQHGTLTSAIGYYNARNAASRRSYTAKVLDVYRRLQIPGT